MLNTYTKHYVNILKNLKEVWESLFGILPTIEKKDFIIPIKRINKKIKDG